MNENTVLQNLDKGATMDFITVKRSDLEREHRVLMDRVQHLRQILGLPPLSTASQQRKLIANHQK